MILQEAQRENAFLRAQFSERTDCIALEKVEAERRLGAVEAETRRLTESLKETCERHAEEMRKQEERVCTSLSPLPIIQCCKQVRKRTNVFHVMKKKITQRLPTVYCAFISSNLLAGELHLNVCNCSAVSNI